MLVKTAFAALLALACAAAAPAQADQAGSLVVRHVTKEIRSYARLTVFDDVSVDVDGGVVTLTGKVTMPHKARDIARRVARIAGVQRVRNEIQVLPVSLFDERLRVQVARAIYGHSAFWPYATMVDPPIHILVENGHVTLTGVVSDNAERTLARSLASSCRAFSVQSELKTDAEMKARPEKTD